MSSPAPGGSSRRSTTCTRAASHCVRHQAPARRPHRRSRRSHRLSVRANRSRTALRPERARSRKTSRACHVGARSSCNASSASSTTTAAHRSGTGASAAMRPPTTTHSPCGCAAPRFRAFSVGEERVQQRNVATLLCEVGGERARPPCVGHAHDRRPRVGTHPRHQRPPVGQGRPAHHLPGLCRSRPSRGAFGTNNGEHNVGCARRAEDRDTRAAPAVRDPGREFDDVGRGSGRDDGLNRQQRRRFGFDVEGDDPAAHAPPVQRNANDGADGDVVVDVVVEAAVYCGEIRKDATRQRVSTGRAAQLVGIGLHVLPREAFTVARDRSDRTPRCA